MNSKISLVIPVFNEFNEIDNFFNDLNDCNFNLINEIIFIDDCSTDKTYFIAKKYAQQGKIKLFRRRKEGSKAILEWTTESEVNNAGFEIYRSYSGREFSTTVGTRPA